MEKETESMIRLTYANIVTPRVKYCFASFTYSPKLGLTLAGLAFTPATVGGTLHFPTLFRFIPASNTYLVTALIHLLHLVYDEVAYLQCCLG